MNEDFTYSRLGGALTMQNNEELTNRRVISGIMGENKALLARDIRQIMSYGSKPYMACKAGGKLYLIDPYNIDRVSDDKRPRATR